MTIAVDDTHELLLPGWWVQPLLYNNTEGLTRSELEAFEAFRDKVSDTFGQCHCLEASDDWFDKTHDAWSWVPLACDIRAYTFDISHYG